MKIVKATTLACLSLAATCALAQNSSDAAFARKAAAGGMAEVKLGELAQSKGSSDTVKEFGKRMETDHTKANDELKNMAAQSGISLPQSLDKKDQETYDRLSKLSGAAFDRAYANDMVSDHEMDISEFKKEASSGKDPNIKKFAEQTLPTLESHLKMAHDMQKSVASGTQTSEYR